MTERPPVWFERAVLPAAVDDVAALADALGPPDASADDPYRDLKSALGAVVSTHVYNAAVMDRGPRLLVIARTGIGYDRVDLAAATERGIAVCNTPDGPTVSTAEHAVALMAAGAKGLKASEAKLRAGGTDDFYAGHRAVELDGKTLGVIGFGRIARRVAAIATAFGMSVKAYDPFLPDEAFAGVTRAADLHAALDADVVSVHVPLNEHTHRLIDAAALAAMRPGSVFVNTARGGLVDQDALLAALESGHLLAAGLDVTEPEPLPSGHPLLDRDDVIVTPHVASGTPESKERIFRTAFRQVLQVIGGEEPDHLVNPEVVDRLRRRWREEVPA